MATDASVKSSVRVSWPLPPSRVSPCFAFSLSSNELPVMLNFSILIQVNTDAPFTIELCKVPAIKLDTPVPYSQLEKVP